MKNEITMVGTIKKSITTKFEGTYAFQLDCTRKSGVIDTMEVYTNDKTVKDLEIGTKILIVGHLMTENYYENNKRKLFMFPFAEKIIVLTDQEYNEMSDTNLVDFEGFLCQPPIYRETPLKKEITNLLLAINTPNKKVSYYIPAITWNKNAVTSKEFNVGDKVSCAGRFQSREYIKDGNTLLAYEISLHSIVKQTETEAVTI